VANLVAVFREVRRVLRADGTLWLVLGDTYFGGTPGSGGASAKQGSNAGSFFNAGSFPLKPKDLVGVPWRVAFALQADGWWLRSDCIWHKPNPMPESGTQVAPAETRTVGWRPTCSHSGAPVPCTVLDPFAGTGTVGQVAEGLGRDSVLIELNAEYVRLIRQRTRQAGLFASRDRAMGAS
jgi:DNA modification methylase